MAALPLAVGLTGDQFYDPASMEDGFHMSVVICAVLCAIGAVIAWTLIRSDLLSADEMREPEPERYSCDICGTRLSPEHDHEHPELAVSRS